MPPTPSISLGPRDIGALIPHRPPFLWLDTVDILETGSWARGFKTIARTEPVFQGHFPSDPVFPGVLIAEALAQTGAVLLGHALRAEPDGAPGTAPEIGYLTRIDLKFLHPARPGQILCLDVRKTSQMGQMVAFNCVAEVDGFRLVEGRLSVAAGPLLRRSS